MCCIHLVRVNTLDTGVLKTWQIQLECKVKITQIEFEREIISSMIKVEQKI